mmetsp:Transcript_40964/g.118363  ORF Transcript_40964/g.118363 Transcript_40964/m.118363 type:complete len:106 (+) Transcript_40964:549-866(+)
MCKDCTHAPHCKRCGTIRYQPTPCLPGLRPLAPRHAHHSARSGYILLSFSTIGPHALQQQLAPGALSIVHVYKAAKRLALQRARPFSPQTCLTSLEVQLTLQWDC